MIQFITNKSEPAMKRLHRGQDFPLPFRVLAGLVIKLA